MITIAEKTWSGEKTALVLNRHGLAVLADGRLTPLRTSQRATYAAKDKKRDDKTKTFVDGYGTHTVASYSRYLTNKEEIKQIAHQVGLTSIESIATALKSASAQIRKLDTHARDALKIETEKIFGDESP